MAVPSDFKESNCVLDKPKDMTTEDCAPLNVLRAQMGDHRVVISCWKITPNELDEIVKSGGRIWITVYGETMPPIAVDGTKPFTELNDGELFA